MQGEKLKEAISILYDMELNNYMMTRCIQQLEQEAAKYGHQKYIAPPQKQFNDVSIAAYVKPRIPFAIILGVVIMLFGVIITTNNYEVDSGAYVFSMFLTMILAYGVAAILIFTGLKAGKDDKAGKQLIIDSIYDKEMQRYNNEMKQEQERVQHELHTADALRVQCNLLETRRSEATTTLTEFYDTVGIDHLFRNIVPIGYMYDLIRLGVSDKLDGIDGLNYLVRQDLRADEFHHTLEEISAKMDIIIDNQRAIYYELQSINEQCSRLVSESVKQTQIAINSQKTLEDIRDNTAVSAYNNERMRKEAEYANTLHTFEFNRK